jgi:hypothetical protein
LQQVGFPELPLKVMTRVAYAAREGLTKINSKTNRKGEELGTK